MFSIGETMNILNQAAGHYPQAVSFLAGRPPDDFVDVSPVPSWIDRFVASRNDAEAERRRLGQYSDTNGICRDVVATYLSRTTGLDVRPDHCMMINGAQEGMLIAAAGLCGRSRIALAADPTYIGFAGAAEVVGVPLETLPDDGDLVARIIDRLERERGRIGCIYLIPEFANPTGRVLTLGERRALVAAAQASGAFILEDTAYRHFRYEGEDLPMLYSLSGGEGVILLESFSKTVMPGLRTGVLVAGATDASGQSLATRLSWIKSYVSIATSPLTQAALAGFLLGCDMDISAWVAPRVEKLRQGRETLLHALDRSFGEAAALGWNRPEGGFFLTLDLGRPFDLDDCFACARDAGVLVLPMQAFSLHGRCAEQVRLSFSNVEPAKIAPAIDRLATWLARGHVGERLSA